MGIVTRFLQDGVPMSIATEGMGDYFVKFHSRGEMADFRSEFERWLEFKSDDARYTRDMDNLTLDITWLI